MRPTRGEIVEYVADVRAYCGEGEQPIMGDRVIVTLADDLAEARALLERWQLSCASDATDILVDDTNAFQERTK